MLAAQFGLPAEWGQGTDVQAFFRLAAVPRWPPEEVYLYPYGDERGDWSALPFPFKSAGV